MLIQTQNSSIKTDDRQKCDEILEILSSYFGIEKPKLEWASNSFGTSKANGYSNRIRIVPRMESNYRLNNVEVLLHEFSHILTHHTYIKNLSFEEKYKRSTSGKLIRVVRSHGIEFKNTLLEVVEVWYGDADKYGWKKDYSSIAKWYSKRKTN